MKTNIIKNKRGQGVFLGVVTAILVFMMGMLFVGFIDDEATNVTGTSGLDCDNMNISDGNKLSCLGVEAISPYFIICILGVTAGIAVGRYLK